MAIIDHLPRARDFDTLKENAIKPMETSGFAHDLYTLGNSGWILRAPRAHIVPVDEAAAYVERQAELYDFASRCGAVPNTLGYVHPNEDLPRGGIIVERIIGDKPQLPLDWHPIGTCLGSLHRLGLGNRPAALAPAAAPLASQIELTEAVFWPHVENAPIADAVKGKLQQAWKQAKAEAAGLDPAIPQTMLGGDCHPGNFLIDRKCKAVFVDLEYAAYDVPTIDLSFSTEPLMAELDPSQKYPRHGTPDMCFTAWSRAAGVDRPPEWERIQPLTDRIVTLGTLGWLAMWEAGGKSDPGVVADRPSRDNWDRLAREYFSPERWADPACSAKFHI